MTVNGINGIGAQPAMGGAGAAEQTDSTCKNLQQQIERLQQELKEVSANQEMPAEAKMKKRQELQKQISELQIQLRQRQIEVKREEREKKKEESSFDDLLGTKGQNAAQSVGLSADSMTAMISADQSVKQANVQGSTATKMEGKANVLETEIALDGARGDDTSRKQAELSDVKAAAQKAEASQLSTLAEAGEALQDAAKSEKFDKQTDEDKEESGTTGNKEKEDPSSAVTDEETSEAMEAGFTYHPVDVRL